MSDPTGPQDPTPSTDGSVDADRAWFHAQVDPIVDHPPVADAWSAIAEQATGGAAGPVPRTLATSKRHTSRVLIAAAVVLLVALGTVVAVRRDRGDHITTGGPGSAGTGFLVPRNLPDGWEVVSVAVRDNPKDTENWGCPCDRWIWGDGQGGHMTVVARSVYGPEEDGTPVDLGPGVTAVLLEGDNDLVLRWEVDGKRYRMRSTDSDTDALVAAGRDLVADPTNPPTGWTLLSHAAGNPEHGSSRVEMQVRTKPDGTALGVLLSPPWDPPRASNIEYPTLKLLDLPDGPALRTPAPWGSEGYVEGLYDHVEVHASQGDLPYQGRPNSRRDAGLDAYETMVRSLRPATAEEWRAFLDTVEEPVSSKLRQIDSLQDLFAPGPSSANPATTVTSTATSTTTVDDPATTTVASSSPDTASTTLPSTPGSNGAIESAPATVTPSEQVQGSDRYSDLTGLSVRLRLQSSVLGVTVPTPGTLLIENTTDHQKIINECSDGYTRAALIPAREPGAELPEVFMVDCYDTPTTTIEPGQTAMVAVPAPGGGTTGFTARKQPTDESGRLGGTLDAGNYLAVVQIPGSTGTIRLSVPVKVLPPPCPMSDEEADRYRDRSVADATAAAERDGRHLVVVSGDGKSDGTGWNLDCDRVRAVVGNGTVVDYVFG